MMFEIIKTQTFMDFKQDFLNEPVHIWNQHSCSEDFQNIPQVFI